MDSVCPDTWALDRSYVVVVSGPQTCATHVVLLVSNALCRFQCGPVNSATARATDSEDHRSLHDPSLSRLYLLLNAHRVMRGSARVNSSSRFDVA